MTSTSTPPEEEHGAPPALFEHCYNTYREMLAQAKSVVGSQTEKGGYEPASHIVVYEGFLTHLVTHTLNLSVPYYTSVRKNLIRMGCIRQLRRGGGSSPSQWELIHEPTEEAFWNVQEPRVHKPSKDAAVQEQIRNLSARVSELEDWRDAVMESLIQHFGVEEAGNDGE
jgi:hypothetical protein